MQGKRKLDVVFTKEMLEEDYLELKSMLKISKKYGVSKKTILNYMNKFGISRREWVVPVKDVRLLAVQGLDSKEIAKELGASRTTVNKVAKANDIEVVNRYHKGYIVTHNGYTMVQRPKHVQADSKGYVRLHRLLMEEHIGRTLDLCEVVHHINGDKSDNRIENLEVMMKADHVRHHHTGKVGRGPSKSPRKNARVSKI